MRWFKKGAPPDADGFYDTAVPAAAVRPDEMTAVEIGGHPLILTRWQGELIAFSSHCPHAAGDLSQGTLYNGRIDCPDHSYRFDVRSGRPLWPEDEVCRLKHYPLRVVGEMVRVKVD